MLRLRRLLAIAKKEVYEILRDPITLVIAIVLPLVMMVLFSYAITLEVREISLAVVDEDHSPESRDYVARFLRSGYFRLHTAGQNIRQVERLLEQGTVRAVLIVPPTFSRRLQQSLVAEVQTLVDGSFSNTALLILNYVDAITQTYALRLQEDALHTAGLARASDVIRVEPRVRYNPALRNEIFVVPSLFAVILMAFPPLLTALAVVRERERGSIQQIYTSPIRVTAFFWGKLLPYALIALLEMFCLLGLAMLWFRIPVRGSLPLLLSLAFLYVLSTVGIGLVISSWTRSQVVALLLAIVLTFMPAFLFSDFLFAIASMPAVFRGYTYVFPARYFMAISRGIALKGLGVADLWPHAAVLVVYTMGLFGLAALKFRKKIG